jgi:hypothetical protein
MWLARLSGGIMLAVAAAVTLTSAGCTKDDSKQDKDRQVKNKESETEKKPGKDGDHGGWWCQEHGVPEHLCSQCSVEVAANCKKEGDWCKVHPDRAKSQCFKCEPNLYKRFEDMYVAKYGKKPEPPPMSEFEK